MSERYRMPFSDLMGIELVSAEPERIEARLPVRRELCTSHDAMHGGAVMAFADTLGAIGTVANLGPGQGTTTIESKTNFIAAAPVGDTVTGVSTPLHRGRSTMVWQTKITRGDGRVVAFVTQTQMVLTRGGGKS